MNEKNEINKILLGLPDNRRMFRNNVGMAWSGVIISKGINTITLNNPRPLHAGLCTGSSDLIGWTTIEVTPDMVGKKLAVFTALEVKTGRVQVTAEQQNFIDTVNKSGGIAEIVRTDS